MAEQNGNNGPPTTNGNGHNPHTPFIDPIAEFIQPQHTTLNGPLPPPTPQEQFRASLGKDGEKLTANQVQYAFNEHLLDMIHNDTTSRSQFFDTLLDPRRDINKECGYPQAPALITAFDYRTMYDSFAIARRVVHLLPDECWKVQPSVYEHEDPDTETPFEIAWDALCRGLSTGSYYQDEHGNPVWDALKRVDQLSGIGRFGVLLLGLNDGKMLHEPVQWAKLKRKGQKLPGDVATKDITGISTTVASGDPAAPIQPVGTVGTDAQYLPISMSPQDTRGLQTGPYSPPSESALKKSQGGQPQRTANPQSQGQDTTKYAAGSHSTIAGQGKDQGDMAGQGSQNLPNQGPNGGMTTDDYGIQFRKMGDSQQPVGQPWDQQVDTPTDEPPTLTFIAPYDEALVQVVQYEASIHSPRFRQPVMYLITLNDPRYPHSGVGLPLATVRVHWSRVIHIADNRGSSESFGVPRMQAVYNNLLDLRKLYGGSAEMFWKGAFMGISFETHPQLGGDVKINQRALQTQVDNYQNTTQRWLMLMGMSAKTLAPQVSDPTQFIEVQLAALCIVIGVPVRIFKGSERGELASTQDEGMWNGRLSERDNNYITPKIICPFVDRLIKIGVLPEPEGFSVVWPEMDSMSKTEKATVASTRTMAMQSYVVGNVSQLMAPMDFLTREMGYDDEDAQSIIDNVEEHLQDMQEDPEGTPGQMAPPPAPGGFDEDGNPLPPEVDPNDPTAQGDGSDTQDEEGGQYGGDASDEGDNEADEYEPPS